jgi:hypothetical protein
MLTAFPDKPGIRNQWSHPRAFGKITLGHRRPRESVTGQVFQRLEEVILPLAEELFWEESLNLRRELFKGGEDVGVSSQQRTELTTLTQHTHDYVITLISMHYIILISCCQDI